MCEELATNERIKRLLFPAANPPSAGERESRRRDGLRPEHFTLHTQAHQRFIRSGGNRRGSCEAGAYLASKPSARELFQGHSAGTVRGSSATGVSSIMMRRQCPWSSD